MKKFLSLITTMVMTLCIFVSTPCMSASAETSGDYVYQILDDGSAEITDYIGNATKVEIPGTLDGYTITSIGEKAFEYCENLKSIDIPDSVTTIGTSAFSYCSSLTEIEIPSSVQIIEDYLFEDCVNLSSVALPDTALSIGRHTFCNCISLTSITIPESIVLIHNCAFY